MLNPLKAVKSLISYKSSILSLLTVATLSTTSLNLLTNSRAIADIKRSQDQIATEIFKHRQEVKSYEAACNDEKVTDTLQNFRDFQIRLDTGINYSQYLEYLADLKIAFSRIENLKNLKADCFSLRQNIEYSLVNYENLEIWLNLRVRHNVLVVDVTHDYAKSMFKIYPELPIRESYGRTYVLLTDFMAYLRSVAYL